MWDYGIWALLILILDIVAIVSVVQSGLTPMMKLVWVLLILVLPLVGMLLWFLIGNKTATV